MLSFMLAHEAGHVLLNHDAAPRPNETPEEYSKRLRANEVAADEWALPTVVRMRIDPYDVVRALFTHLVIFGSKEEGDGQVHRDDLTRIKHVAEVYAREFPYDYSSFNATVAKLIVAVTPADGIGALVDYLDAKSDQASFNRLQYGYRKNPVANLSDICRPPDVIPAWIRELSDKLYHPK